MSTTKPCWTKKAVLNSGYMLGRNGCMIKMWWGINLMVITLELELASFCKVLPQKIFFRKYWCNTIVLFTLQTYLFSRNLQKL